LVSCIETLATTRPRLTVTLESPGILTLHWGAGEIHDGDWRRHFEVWADSARNGRPFVLLSDVRGTEPPNAKRRAEVIAFERTHRAELERTQRGAVIVVANALQRGVITAFLWLTRPPFPVRVVTDYDEARALCVSLLAH
jgi:hypothetical protein